MAGVYEGESKPAHRSLTIQGLLVLLAGMLVQHFGLPLDEQFLEEVIPVLLEIVGLGMAAVGRVRAEQPLRLPGGGQGTALGLVLVLSCTSLAACGGKGLTPDETVRTSADVLAQAYLAMDADYLELRDQSAASPAALRAIAQGLRQARAPVAALVRLAALESRVANYNSALEQAKREGGSFPLFQAYVPPYAVQAAVDLVAQAVGSAEEFPQGKQAVLAFLSSQAANIHQVAASAMNQLAQSVAAAKEAADAR